MTYVVTQACIACKYTDCVEVCPVDCFHEGPNFLAINPDECIDCGLCEVECPVEAIVSEAQLDEAGLEMATLNAELCLSWPLIKKRKEPLPDAEKWKTHSDKLALLQR